MYIPLPMHVVIVESPAKCKTIGKYLGSDYKVLASYGHIRDLPSKDGSVKPDQDFAMNYQISKGSSKHVTAIADAVKNADTLLLATDPDREGEAISWHVLEALKEKNKLPDSLDIKRVVFHSITKKAVTEAVANPRDIDMDLVNAQQARRALDYLVGFTISPVLWRKLPGSKSAGRVQSVALRLVCEREDEIEQFKPQEYWDIEGEFTNSKGDKFNARLNHVQGEKLDKFDIPNEAKATEIKNNLEGKTYSVANVEKKEAKRNPAAPFTTSTLQQEAFRKLGFGAKKTMMVAQKLYEGADYGSGLITYMRTDAVNLAGEAIAACRDTITQLYGANYVPDSPRQYKSKAKNTQEAHEAIRPTDPSRTPDSLKSQLNADESKLYELIWKRTIACQMASAILDQVGADIVSNDNYATFRATGSTIKFDGFLKLYFEGHDDDEDDEKSNKLPELAANENTPLEKVEAEQHFTQPPPRYSEASLVKRMEELGIGRPSTYASIISILVERGYARLEKKRFVAEPRGRVVTAFLTNFFTHYVEYEFTAYLEDELDQISAGDLGWKDVLNEFWGDFNANAEAAMNLETTQIISELNKALEYLLFPGEGDVEERRKCPSCDDGKLSLKNGKFGPFLGCSNYPDCNFTKPLEGAGSDDKEGEDKENKQPEFETKILGTDENDEEISVRKGPYGFYVQVGEGKKPKRSSLPKNMNPDIVTLQEATGLLTLPREVGNHPETGKVIKAGLGRYGPYLLHDGKYTSLKGEDDVLTIGMNRAVDLIAESKTKGKKAAEPLRVLGDHPETDGEIAVYDGRYGPYVKHKKLNASLPKGTTPESVTIEQAVELLEKQAAKKKAKGKK